MTHTNSFGRLVISQMAASLATANSEFCRRE
jgi:hypothetical protein